MFWKFNLLTSSHVDTLLEKEEVTLRELMDEDDILQECKAQNRKLIDFLTQPSNMEDMVSMIIKEPAVNVEERLRFKYPNTACELLTSDVSQINDKLASNRDLIDRLYSFLEAEEPLNPLLASFFSKIMGLLITRKSEMIFEYLKSRKDFVGSLLHHIGTSAIMDLLLRLITCIESPETRHAVIEWLNEQQIVQRLVDCIVPSKDEDVHCNAAQSLCDIVRLGREQIIQLQDASDPDPLLATVELEETVSKLISNMFDLEENESVIVNGLFVIHTLLEIRRQGQETVGEHLAVTDADHSQGISNVLAAIKPRLKDFHDLLTNPPKAALLFESTIFSARVKALLHSRLAWSPPLISVIQQRYSTMPTSVGTLEPPLGNARLQVAKLITALIARNTGPVNIELVHLKTLHALLDLYFQYIWNNFLHTQVEQCIILILNNPAQQKDGSEEHPLLAQLFTDVNLVQRLLNEWQENDQQQKAEGGRRKGFMGHLTKMANAVSSAVEKGGNSELIKKYLFDLPEDCRQKWESFVSGTLAEVNKKNAVEFRGHPLASSSEDDDSDFKDIPFPQDTAMQQAFSDYQLQQMTSNFIDQFGFNEEEFAEQEDKIDSPFSDRISSINFNIQANEVAHPNSTMFEQACNERIQQFDDDDSDEDIWVEKPLTFDRSAKHTRLGRLQGETAQVSSSDDSTDSEEELDSPHSISQQPSTDTNSKVDSSATVTVPFIAGVAEKMDVDSCEAAWPADLSCSHQSSQIESSAMDTGSPWESSNPPAESHEGWANFDKSEPEEDSWADFNTFSDVARGSASPRSSSPVDMDTSENSKGNICMLNVDSASSASGCMSSCTEVKVPTLKHENEDRLSTLGPHLEISPTIDCRTSDIPADAIMHRTSDSTKLDGINQESPHHSTASSVVSAVKKEHAAVNSIGSNNDSLYSTEVLEKINDGEEHSINAKSTPGAGDHTYTEGDPVQESNSTADLKIKVLRTLPKESREEFDSATGQLAEPAVPNGPV